MAKKTNKEEKAEAKESNASGKQLELIDVAPENAKPIIAAGRRYKKAQKARLEALAEEIKLKDKIRQLAKDANIKRLENGVIRFTYNGVTICITPQDEKVTVKDETAQEE